MVALFPTGQMYEVYVDDTGTKNRLDTQSNLFSYVAVVIDSQKEPPVRRRIRDLKRRVFGTHNVELKSRWFRLPKERERHYLKPYSLTQSSFNDFSEKVFRVISSSPLHCIGSVVNKTRLTSVLDS